MQIALKEATLVAILAITFTLCGISPATAEEPTVLKAGTLTLKIYESETAHLFHVVDQISLWSQFCHRQYLAYFGDLSVRDNEMLEKHRQIRGKHSWGQGLEQTFYSPESLDAAIEQGIENGHITAAEGETEREILTHFRPRVIALREAERDTLAKFVLRIRGELDALTKFSADVSRFCGGAEPIVPVYPIANPHDRNMGGGYNGGRLTLEVPREYDYFPIFLHELLHAYVNAQKEQVQQAASTIEGLDYETLNEGIAYALAPGLFHPGSDESDPLADEVSADFAAGKGLSDSYVRFRRLGLALRPLLDDALHDESQTLEDFLPRALDAWRVITQLDSAYARIQKGSSGGAGSVKRSKPGTFAMFPEETNIWQKVAPIYRELNQNLWGRNHTKTHYDEMFGKHTQPGDYMILMFAMDLPDRIPPSYIDLLPKPWPEIEAGLSSGKTVTLRGKARDLDILLIATPTVKELEDLLTPALLRRE